MTHSDRISTTIMKMRTGIGYDVHQLARGRKLIIGGVEIPYHKGSLAHSDGDVLIHALCDALLGAVAMGDIGLHFPDTESKYKDIDSMVLLDKVTSLISEKGYGICNIDSVICLQKPKLREHITAMQNNIARVMKINPEDVSVKATTTEKLGFTGREEGISAHVVVLLGPLS